MHPRLLQIITRRCNYSSVLALGGGVTGVTQPRAHRVLTLPTSATTNAQPTTRSPRSRVHHRGRSDPRLAWGIASPNAFSPERVDGLHGQRF